MSEISETLDRNLDAVQAAELALLVDLEARWENLRTTPSRPPSGEPTKEDLHGKQRAYEAFRTKLAAYNKRFAPAHVPELLLNTSTRLGIWCRAMRDLYLRVEKDPRGHCPAHLLEKAYRCADRVAAKVGQAPRPRPAPPGTIPAAIRDLEAVARWCEELAN